MHRRRRDIVIFDVLSFAAGVLAGVGTGVLAGVLHGLESTSELQERVRRLTREVDRMKSVLKSQADRGDASSEIDQLSNDLEEIHKEIRRMYKK
jgi:peptidoglycan hydrolase CwlO-like protein